MKNLTSLLFIFFSSKLCAQIDTNLIYHKAENIIKLIEGEKIDSLLINIQIQLDVYHVMNLV